MVLAWPVDFERTVHKAAEGVDKLRDVSGDHIVLERSHLMLAFAGENLPGNSETMLVYLFTETGIDQLGISTRICGRSKHTLNRMSGGPRRVFWWQYPSRVPSSWNYMCCELKPGLTKERRKQNDRKNDRK